MYKGVDKLLDKKIEIVFHEPKKSEETIKKLIIIFAQTAYAQLHREGENS